VCVCAYVRVCVRMCVCACEVKTCTKRLNAEPSAALSQPAGKSKGITSAKHDFRSFSPNKGIQTRYGRWRKGERETTHTHTNTPMYAHTHTQIHIHTQTSKRTLLLSLSSFLSLALARARARTHTNNTHAKQKHTYEENLSQLG